jgi:hypothetical protein
MTKSALATTLDAEVAALDAVPLLLLLLVDEGVRLSATPSMASMRLIIAALLAV